MTDIKHFSVLIDKLDISHKISLMIHNLNTLVVDNYIYNPTIFYNSLGKSLIYPQFTRLGMQHAWGYEGPMISTDIGTTQILNKCIRTTKKMFYVFDLEWLHIPNIQFSLLTNIYQNNNIELIARSQSHYDVLTRVWKKPIGILEDFNYEQLIMLF